jgi:hypothetical protein
MAILKKLKYTCVKDLIIISEQALLSAGIAPGQVAKLKTLK